ncbi:MAG: BON domain-containing protein [Thermoguttaceae bacterium]|nr:BON domain-containing protein [Thermoguttaceae bacterium]MDW8077651.1 BON domain-containing protein [Thermoguttaceae bacterium]
MRRLVSGFLVLMALITIGQTAFGGNQELADRIAANLRESGQLRNYRIEIRVEDGTAILQGSVANMEQMNTALRIAAQTDGVARVINRLTVSTTEAGGVENPPSPPRLLTPMPTQAPQAEQAVAQAPAPSPSVEVVPASTAEPGPGLLIPPNRQVELQRATNSSAVSRTAKVTEPAPAQEPAQVVLIPSAAMLGNRPLPIAYVQPRQDGAPGYVMPVAAGPAPMVYNQPYLPNYAWPSYAAYPNYAALTYPRQYSPTAWPYIGPFYPYPQVPLGWRRVSLEWHDGWWFLDFDDGSRSKGLLSGILHPLR